MSGLWKCDALLEVVLDACDGVCELGDVVVECSSLADVFAREGVCRFAWELYKFFRRDCKSA